MSSRSWQSCRDTTLFVLGAGPPLRALHREKSETPGGTRDAETFVFCCKLRGVTFLLEIQVWEEK